MSLQAGQLWSQDSSQAQVNLRTINGTQHHLLNRHICLIKNSPPADFSLRLPITNPRFHGLGSRIDLPRPHPQQRARGLILVAPKHVVIQFFCIISVVDFRPPNLRSRPQNPGHQLPTEWLEFRKFSLAFDHTHLQKATGISTKLN